MNADAELASAFCSSPPRPRPWLGGLLQNRRHGVKADLPSYCSNNVVVAKSSLLAAQSRSQSS